MSKNIFKLKKLLRSNIIKNLKKIENVDKRSELLIKKFTKESYFASCTHISLYLPLKYHREIHTIPLLYQCLEENKKVYVPVVGREDDDEDKMYMYNVVDKDDFDSFKKFGKYQILEPPTFKNRSKLLEDLEKGDEKKNVLMLIPGLGFAVDEKTGKYKRIGKGKGYYDKYLASLFSKSYKMVEKIQTVAMCYKDEQILDDVPVSDTDYLIDSLIF